MVISMPDEECECQYLVFACTMFEHCDGDTKLCAPLTTICDMYAICMLYGTSLICAY